MDDKYLKVELQSLGVRCEGGDRGRLGGAGPAEGRVFVLGTTHASVPIESPFVSTSPYWLARIDGKCILRRGDEEIGEVGVPPTPRFYERRTRNGVEYRKIALLHGVDCLASTVVQRCVQGSRRESCAFCGIHISLKNGGTILNKKPEWLGEVAEAAVVLDGVKHVTLTSGAFEKIGEELDFLASCCRAIKERTTIPVHIQCMPPEEEGAFVRLRAAGVDTVGIHIESFDRGVLKRAAPGKAAIGLSCYLRAWKEAVEVFGKNQVSSFLIVGLGESRTSILEGAEMLSTLGVYPFIVPLRPIPGTPLGGKSPPAPDEMASIYEAASPVLFTHGVSSSLCKAGCVRCAACSALPDFERRQ